MINASLNKALLDAVDSGLLVLGENSRKAIYFHLEKTFKIKREEIALKFEEFKESLEDIFGPGAEIIKEAIIRELRAKLDLDFEEKESFELASYVGIIQEVHNVGRQKEEKRRKN
jgi:hypothetical protein